MTTALAPSPSSSALGPPSIEQTSSAPRSFPAIAPSTGTPSARNSYPANGLGSHSPPSNHDSPPHRTPSDGKSSPISSRAAPPKVIVKKEPASPEMSNSRHRPRRLDLSKGGSSQANPTNGQPSAGPKTAKESAGLAIQDVGLACLSPGFHTQDPAMREHLQRSLSVREQQRQIIEARQKGGATSGNKSTPPDHNGEAPNGLFRPKAPGTSRRKGPPPGLSINAPSHDQFANDRVIQSAPLHQTFTGLQRNIHPLTRQVANQPTPLSNTSHIHHVPATQTNNRLPPISDVFPGDSFPNGPQSSRAANFPHNNSPGHSSHSNIQPPIPSPGLPPPHQSYGPTSQTPYSQPPPSSTGHRQREYKSAEDAINTLSGGREELLPRIVHYGGHQPPTPPSPMPHQKRDGALGVPSGGSASGSSADRGISRRRDRDEFERDMSPPPLGRRRTGDMMERREDREARWAEGRWERDSPETRQRKKEEFISLCSRAWDLFHS